MSLAIRVENLSKQYRLGLTHAGSIRELVNRFTAKVRGKKGELLPHELAKAHTNGQQVGPDGTFWALKDVSFDVKEGEVLGIIGRNGAGKSTLLKILSRITAPTQGRVELYGRVASLLEVGTGFHPELTGRENVSLNGAILGMTRSEIKRKFDEIVAFAEIEKFIDTPVKRYSSGMYVRLAFAVAAHLDPEILIVDEVLAVGDALFQKKCLGKMGDVARTGRTVLFVSHNMESVVRLCGRAILLENGALGMVGQAAKVSEHYLSTASEEAPEICWSLDDAPGNSLARLCAVRVLKHSGEPECHHSLDDPITLEMDYAVLAPGKRITSKFQVYNVQGSCLFAVATNHIPDWSDRAHEPGRYRARCVIPRHYLNEGRHYVSAFVIWNQAEVVAAKVEAVCFVAHDYGTTRGRFTGRWIGAVRPVLPWHIEKIAGVS